MRLFLDLDTRSFIESVQFQRAVASLALKRRDRMPVDVQFLRAGVAVELSDGATGKLGLKADKDFNGPFAASDLDWTKSGTGDTTSYRFDLNLNTVQISALFAGVPTPPSVALMLEIEWTEGDLRTSSRTLAVTLENDIVRGDEGVADEGSPVYPLPNDLLSAANIATATVAAGEDAVDFAISGFESAPTLCVPLGIQKPNAAANNIGILCAFPLSSTSLRAFLTAAPSEPGYQAAVFFR